MAKHTLKISRKVFKVCLGIFNIMHERVNPLSANPRKWSNALKPYELFECVWPFCGVGA